jgi:hypothetical protein
MSFCGTPSDVFARSKNVSKNYNVYRRQGLEQTKQRQWAMKWQRIFSMMRFLRERESLQSSPKG